MTDVRILARRRVYFSLSQWRALAPRVRAAILSAYDVAVEGAAVTSYRYRRIPGVVRRRWVVEAVQIDDAGEEIFTTNLGRHRSKASAVDNLVRLAADLCEAPR